MIKDKTNYRSAYDYYEDKLKIANDLGYKFVDDAIIDLYENKKNSAEQIGNIFGVTGTAILMRLEKLHIKRRSQGSSNFKYNKEIREKIKSEMKEGKKRTDIAKKYGCSLATMYNIMKDYKGIAYIRNKVRVR